MRFHASATPASTSTKAPEQAFCCYLRRDATRCRRAWISRGLAIRRRPGRSANWFLTGAATLPNDLEVVRLRRRRPVPQGFALDGEDELTSGEDVRRNPDDQR